MWLFDFLLIIGFFYSTVGAFWAARFFLRNDTEEKIHLWIVTVVVYLFWPLVVFDATARRAMFDRRQSG